MCGIVGYVGHRPVQELLLEGLRKLEYRGYDSAGISLVAGDSIESVRAVGNLEHLDNALEAKRNGGGGALAPQPPPTRHGPPPRGPPGPAHEGEAPPHPPPQGR